MESLDIENLKLQITNQIDAWYKGQLAEAKPSNEEAVPEPPKHETPAGKRAVRTKSSGDRVYILDEEAKTRRWVTNPEVLKSVGFEIGDVVDIDDSELLSYQMAPALYRVE